MNCQKCYGYIQDYIHLGVPHTLTFRQYLNLKHSQKVFDFLAKSCLEIKNRLTVEEYNKAVLTASRIARRGRNLLDYSFLIQTAILNFLRFEIPWFRKEIDVIKCYLIEEGFIRHKVSYYALKAADEYLCFMFPQLLGIIFIIHNDHMNPKGLHTDVHNSILSSYSIPKPVTL